MCERELNQLYVVLEKWKKINKIKKKKFEEIQHIVTIDCL